MKLLKLLRWILVTLIIGGFAYGITEAICEKIKSSLTQSGGLVLASDLTKLQYAPLCVVGFVMLISFLIWHEIHKND